MAEFEVRSTQATIFDLSIRARKRSEPDVDSAVQ